MRTLTVLLLALVLVAGADIVTFQPDAAVGKDSWVNSYYPDTTFGEDNLLIWGSGDGFMVATYIEFVELYGSEYQGAAVNSASLNLYLRDVDGTGNFEVGACDESWNEDTITWNTKVGVIESFEVDYPENGYEWFFLDVTDHVQNWLDGSWSNYGFCLYGYFDQASAGAYSSDYTDDPTLRPKLVLDYSGAAVEETTWGEIKASL